MGVHKVGRGMMEALREACRLSGAGWAVWVQIEEGRWTLGVGHGLTARRREALQRLLQRAAWRRWLAGGMSSGRARQRRVPASFTVLGEHITLIPLAQGGWLVGAALDATQKAWWRLVPSPAANGVGALPEVGVLYRAMMAPLHQGPFDLGEALHSLLRTLIGSQADVRGGYFVVREGETLRVLAVHGVTLSRQLGKLAEMPKAMQQALLAGEPVETPQDVLGGGSTGDAEETWLYVPLTLGRRWLGMLAFACHAPAVAALRSGLAALAPLLAPGIEVLLTFEEVTGLLRRATLSNEVALALARSPDAHTAIRRLIRYLRVIFHTDRVLVVVPKDERFFVSIGLEREQLLPIEGSLSGWVYRHGQTMRVDEVSEAPEYYPLWPDTRSQVSVPMRLGQRVLGVVTLESREPRAFDEEDAKLLQVLANHLALFIEVGRLTEALGQRLRWLDAVHAVMVRVSGLVEEPELVRQVATDLAERLGYDGVVVLLDEGDAWVVRGVGGPLAQRVPLGTRLSRAEAWGEPDLGEGTEPVGVARAPWIPWEVYTGARFALQGPEGPLGLLWVIRRGEEVFGRDEHSVLETLAEAVSGMLVSARRYAQVQRYAGHLDVARRTALDIGANLEMDVLLRRVVSRVKQLLGAKGAELGLLNPERGVVEVVVSENPWRDYTGMVIPLMRGVAGRAAALGETVVVEDYNRWNGREPSAFQAPFRAVVSVPLKFEHQVLGVLTVYDDRLGRRFLPEEVQLLEILAPQVALAIRNARLYAELEQRMRQQAEAEARLLQSARLAAIGEMAAGVAHELNNPLTTVSGFVELVLEDLPSDAPWREDLTLVLKEARRAQGIVRRLLDFARPTDTTRLPTDLNALLEESLELVRNMLRTQGVQLELALDEDLPLVYAAPGPIKQVFLNLLNNALQAMPQGGRLRIVSGVRAHEGRPGVFVQVQDTGVGIPAEVLPRIFDPFFTTKPPGEGTGLGLAVSYAVVRQHDGALLVESQEGEGSTFTVWLPLDEEA